MKRNAGRIRLLAAAVAIACAVPSTYGEPFTWRTIVNNADGVPGTDTVFNSYNQPSVNKEGIVVFRARGKVRTDTGGEGEEKVAISGDVYATGEAMVDGVFMRNMGTLGPIRAVAKRGDPVPAPNNTLYNGVPAGFNEFPSTPRIDALSTFVATRGQSSPVYTFLLPDGVSESRIGTSGIYVMSAAGFTTGASLLGNVMETQPDTSYGLTFPYFSVPDVLPGTRFDQFPGSPAATDGSKIAWKGNFTDPADSLGKTGVYFRDIFADGGKSPTTLIASSASTLIPNQPIGGTTKFGATAGPSAANGYVAFTGWDNEDAPTMGGIYRAPFASSPALQKLVGIGDAVPGEPEGSTFRNFGEGLSMSADGRFVSFWATWGAEANPKVLYCPNDGNKDRLAYCKTTYGDAGYTVQIPVHQGIFVVDAQSGNIWPIAKTGQDSITDLMYWVYSGAPPGVGGGGESGSGESGGEGTDVDESREPPRWRSSAFSALARIDGYDYGWGTHRSPYQVAFKATRDGVDGIYLRRGHMPAPLETVVETIRSPGQSIDPMAPASSIVTAVGIERDGFRHDKLAIAVSMLYETVETSIGWAGLYLTQVPALQAGKLDATLALQSSVNPSMVGQAVTLTATATGTGALPTGAVSFLDDGLAIASCGSVALNGGVALCTTSSLAAGLHSVRAFYAGDGNYNPDYSGIVDQTVNPKYASVTALASSLNPSNTGQAVTFNAAITGAAGAATGTVDFLDGTEAIAGCSAVPVSAGAAACTIASFGAGVHNVTASYSGDTYYLASASDPVAQTVIFVKLDPIVRLGTSVNPSNSGQSVTFTASVTGAIGTPTGALNFLDGAASIPGCEAVALASGGASCSTAGLAVGTHAITAQYAGDANYNAAASGAVNQTVQSWGVTGEAKVAVDADFNADGSRDLVWQKADGSLGVWLMNGTGVLAAGTVLPAAAGPLVTKVGDFNGDGRTDFVRQFGDGSIKVYLMNGTVVGEIGTLLPAGTGRTLLNVGDFNGDRKADLVLQVSDGATELMLVDGTAVLQQATIMPAAVASGWYVTKVADFSGDGKADLVWTNVDGGIALWVMDGTTGVDKRVLMASGSGWRVLQAADFNADRKADLLFLHTTGAIGLWLMDGTQPILKQSVFSAATGWSITQIGDFNGDRRADLVWTYTGGDTGIWLMDGPYPSVKQVVMSGNTGWLVHHTADLNGDGKQDLLWSFSDGSFATWLMNGTTHVHATTLQGPGSGWMLSPSVAPNN